jgi:hypothetical protein
MTVLLVTLGAAVGAPLRFLVDRAVQARQDSVFPWGTFTVNATGSFLLGALAATAQHTGDGDRDGAVTGVPCRDEFAPRLINRIPGHPAPPRPMSGSLLTDRQSSSHRRRRPPPALCVDQSIPATGCSGIWRYGGARWPTTNGGGRLAGAAQRVLGSDVETGLLRR